MKMASSTSSKQEISWILTHSDNVVPVQTSRSVQFKTKQKLIVKFLTLFNVKDVDFMYF